MSDRAGHAARAGRVVLLLAGALVVGLGAVLLLVGLATGLPVVVGDDATGRHQDVVQALRLQPGGDLG